MDGHVYSFIINSLMANLIGVGDRGYMYDIVVFW